MSRIGREPLWAGGGRRNDLTGIRAFARPAR